MQHKDTCQTCQFWPRSNNEERGESRRRSPQIFAHVYAPAIQSAFPKTARTDWCGEWERMQTSGSYLEDQDLVVLS
jgi:hypothetical protein